MNLLRQIESNTDTLTSFELNSFLLPSRIAAALAAALSANTVITTLRLVDTRLGDEGALFIASALAGNASLTVVSLESNDIRNQGAEGLASSLMNNSCLTELNLSYNKIDNSGVQSFIKALKFNVTLSKLLLWGNLHSTTAQGTINTITHDRADGCYNMSNLNMTDIDADNIPFHLVTSKCRSVDFRSNPGLSRVPLSLRHLDPAIVKHIFLDPHLLAQTSSRHSSKNIITQAEGLFRTDVAPLNHSKLIVLGNSASGKTSLLRALNGRSFCPNVLPSHGIDINTISLGDNHLHIWGTFRESILFPLTS